MFYINVVFWRGWSIQLFVQNAQQSWKKLYWIVLAMTFKPEVAFLNLFLYLLCIKRRIKELILYFRHILNKILNRLSQLSTSILFTNLALNLWKALAKLYGKLSWFMKALKDTIHIAGVSHIRNTTLKLVIFFQVILPIYSLQQLLLGKVLLLWRNFLILEKRVSFIKDVFYVLSWKWVWKIWSIAILKSYSNSKIKHLLIYILAR